MIEQNNSIEFRSLHYVSPRSKAERILDNSDWCLNLLSKLVKHPFPLDLNYCFASQYCIDPFFKTVYPDDAFSSKKNNFDYTKIEKHRIWKTEDAQKNGYYLYRNILIATSKTLDNGELNVTLNPDIFGYDYEKTTSVDLIQLILQIQRNMAQVYVN